MLPALLVAMSIQQTPAPLGFQWKAGEVLTYAVRQTTTVDEILPNDVTKKLQEGRSVATLTLGYTWSVDAVSPQGVATLRKTVTMLKSETKRTMPGPDGKPVTETDTLDSSLAADLPKMPFLNKTAVTAKIDSRGTVLEAASDFGQASLERFKTELPFRLTLPAKALSAGLAWEREFAIALDPKFGGTGETYPAIQSCMLKGMSGAYAVFAVSSKLKTEPKTPNELRPLIPLLWQGDVFIDPVNGRYHACKLTAGRELKDHEGEGTKFAYTSEYVESMQEKK
jgi:hypothetical protein